MPLNTSDVGPYFGLSSLSLTPWEHGRSPQLPLQMAQGFVIQQVCQRTLTPEISWFKRMTGRTMVGMGARKKQLKDVYERKGDVE